MELTEEPGMTENANLYLKFQTAMAQSTATDFLRVPDGPRLAYQDADEECGQM